MSLFSIFFDLVAILRTSKSDKEVEILILRQQVRILQRKTKSPSRISDPERMVLATLLDRYSKFKDGARQHLHQVMLIFKPEPVLRWHRELVRRKWTFKRKGKPGRPVISPELEASCACSDKVSVLKYFCVIFINDQSYDLNVVWSTSTYLFKKTSWFGCTNG